MGNYSSRFWITVESILVRKSRSNHCLESVDVYARGDAVGVEIVLRKETKGWEYCRIIQGIVGILC